MDVVGKTLCCHTGPLEALSTLADRGQKRLGLILACSSVDECCPLTSTVWELSNHIAKYQMAQSVPVIDPVPELNIEVLLLVQISTLSFYYCKATNIVQMPWYKRY